MLLRRCLGVALILAGVCWFAVFARAAVVHQELPPFLFAPPIVAGLIAIAFGAALFAKPGD